MAKLPRPSRSQDQEERHSRRALRKVSLFRFEPKLDMTMWELARFIAVLVEDKPMHFERFFSLIPEPLQRHFRHVKNG